MITFIFLDGNIYLSYAELMQLATALEKVKWFNTRKVATSLSYLPIAAKNEADIAQNEQEYLKVLAILDSQKIDSDITIKLHQFGLYYSVKSMNASVERLVKEAKRLGNFVWIDMEQYDTVDATIRLFEKMHDKYGNVGICMQAYLKRTEDDLNYLLKKKVPVRLVKGFYKNHDFKSWKEVTANFKKLMKLVLLKSRRPCIAGHDFRMIAEAKKLIKKHHIKKAELQFFNHVRDSLAVRLKKEGFNVRVYMPFGNVVGFLWHGGRTFDFLHGMERLLHFKVR